MELMEGAGPETLWLPERRKHSLLVVSAQPKTTRRSSTGLTGLGVGENAGRQSVAQPALFIAGR